jgi:hypothetical protein
MHAIAQYSEPIVISDVFVTNLAEIEDCGDGNYRFTFTVYQHGEHIVVSRLVAPYSLVLRGSKASLAAIGTHCECEAMRSALHH